MTVGTTLTRLGDITVWDCRDASAKLYTVVATLLVGSTPVHDYQVRTGFRTISFQEDGFYLNGRRVTLFGLNRHQFYPFAGGAMPARVQARDAQILREELNCTMVRCSHYPQSEDFLDACDELGLMVWDEAPGWGYVGDPAWQDLACRDVAAMIVRDRNHPSVILWGARLNETDDDQAFYGKTNEIAKSLDNSRPTVGAMNNWRPSSGNYQQDVYSFNDYSHVSDVSGGERRGGERRGGERQSVKRPALQPPVAGMPYMVSEAIGTLSGPARFYRRTDTQAVQQGQATAHATVHDIAASDDRYCGLVAWSGFDYPSGSGRNRHRGVKCTGVADLFRIPKPGAAIYQAQVAPGGRRGDRARVLLGLRQNLAGQPPDRGDDLLQPRLPQGVCRRKALHDGGAGQGRLRAPHVPAVVRRLLGGERLGSSRTARRRLPRPGPGRFPPVLRRPLR